MRNKNNRWWFEMVYNQIIEKARGEKDFRVNGYFEIHHIIPKCLGGSDKEENLVKVTVREHILLHILLMHLNPDNSKIVFAANAMLMGYPRKDNFKNFSTRTLAEIRENFIKELRTNGIEQKNGKVAFLPKTAICFDENFTVIREYSPAVSCSIDGFYSTSVCRACRGDETFGHKYAGYYWMYLEEFIKEHPKEHQTYLDLIFNGEDLPEIDLSYNNLTYKEKLKRRTPYRKMDEEWIKHVSEANKGKKKNISKEKIKIARKKAKETMKSTGRFGGRKRIKVVTPKGIFSSLTEAGKSYGVSRKTIKNWINTGKDGFNCF